MTYLCPICKRYAFMTTDSLFKHQGFCVNTKIPRDSEAFHQALCGNFQSETEQQQANHHSEVQVDSAIDPVADVAGNVSGDLGNPFKDVDGTVEFPVIDQAFMPVINELE